MNSEKYFKDFDDFDKESQNILSGFQNKVLAENLSQSNLSVQSVEPKVTNISESMSEITDWITDEYIDLERLIIKIKAANSGMNDYQFTYNPKDLNANIQNKSIKNKSEGFIQLKVYRNPKIGNVSVKWKDSRITQKIDLRSKKIYYRLHFYYAKSTETSFVLETSWYQDFRDLNILLNYGDVDKYEADYTYFRQNFVTALRNEKDADGLKFIYENIPETILKNFSDFLDYKLFFDHLETLSKDDDSSTFRDSSAAMIQIFKAFGHPAPILNYFRENSAKLNRIYYNLDKSGEYNGKILSNRMILANIMLVFSMFSKNSKQKKTAKTFTIGKGYKINANILEGGIFQQDGDNYRETFFLQQQKEETVTYNIQSSQTMGTSGSGERTITTNIDDGAQFHPLDMVYIKDITGEKEVSYFVPAIYLKALADAQEWEVVSQNIRIAADIVAVIIGVLTLPAGNPYFLLLAIADISLAGADLTIQAFKDEIIKYEDGKEFLDAWEEIYMYGGGALIAGNIVGGFYIGAAKLLTKIAEGEAKNYLKSIVIKVALERNITNFTESSIKLLSTGKEAFFDSNYLLRVVPIQRLLDKDVLIFSGKSAGSKNDLNEYVFIYKGEKIAAGSAYEINKKLAGALKASAKDDEIVAFLDNLERLSKVESGEAFKHLYEVLPLLNKKIIIVDGKEVLVEVSNTHCVNMVVAVDEYLRTGKISIALPSGNQKIEVLSDFYNKKYNRFTYFQRIDIKTQLNLKMKEGEMGIIFGERKYPETGHVFNVLKKDGKLYHPDGQAGKEADLNDGFIFFKYLKIE
ncbi:hypothetical protein VUJ46_16455 [Chryseobacterium sp. MYb264]|uniref:hypothetical protein n=1 Tax=Chryseobacterium sp. MYb264 TaxID=2745153 RepID=UPI002E141ED6|nr:hypothetical protein VUJ46_16455 [Chryseobacterium sp. MYb264]